MPLKETSLVYIARHMYEIFVLPGATSHCLSIFCLTTLKMEIEISSETPVKNLTVYTATYPTRLKSSSKCCRNPKSRISVEFPKYSYKYAYGQRVY